MTTRRTFLRGLGALAVMAGPLGRLAPHELMPKDQLKILNGSDTHVTFSMNGQSIRVSGLGPNTMYNIDAWMTPAGMLEVGDVVSFDGKPGNYTVTRIERV